MATNYLPTRQAELARWANDFSALITADPEAYGLTAPQATAYTSVRQKYVDALDLATNPNTRSPVNIEKKNTAKKALIAKTRELVDICQAWPEMTNDKRAELGITVRDNTPTPTPIPTNAPKVSVASVSGRLFNLELRKDDSTSRAKPSGVRAAWIYTAFGDEQPTTFESFNFRGEARRTDTQIVMPQSVAPGTKVWVSACWVNNAGKPGPASLPIATWTTHGNMNVAA